MNRLHPDHLKKWRALYAVSLASFNRGTLSEYECLHNLMDLNFKHQALEVEMNEFKRERAKWRSENGLNPQSPRDAS